MRAGGWRGSGRCSTQVLANHDYPPVIEKLLAEALVLTALLGSLLKDPTGQTTLQAQTENGIVDLLVCDYLGGELRGYVRHDPERLAEAGPNPSLFALFGKGYLAITFDQPATDERYQGIVPLEGNSLAEAAQSYFTQSEQIPSIVRLAAEKRDGGWSAGGLLFQHLPEGEEGRDRLHTRLDHPDWPHVAIARRVGPGRRADRSRAAARRSRLAPVPRGGRGADAGAAAPDAGLPLRPRLCPLGDRPLPGRRARGDGRRGRADPGRLRILLVELPDRAGRGVLSRPESSEI